jgi:hypothetical protein
MLSAIMAESTSPTDQIANSAAGPLKVEVQGMGRSEEHPLPDQIAAAKFTGTAANRKKVGGGMKFTKASAGGAV